MTIMGRSDKYINVVFWPEAAQILSLTAIGCFALAVPIIAR